jgi:hypothetical protein
MELAFFDAVDDSDYLPDEDRKASYWETLPIVGSPTAMGGQRLWEIVGVDTYHDPAHPENRLHLYHCDIKGRRSRDEWQLVQRNRQRPQTLHAYLGDAELVHWMVSLEGQKNLTGFLLPQYDPRGEMAYVQSWGVEAIQVFHPTTPEKPLPYRAIVLGKCVYAPEAARQLCELVEAS